MSPPTVTMSPAGPLTGILSMRIPEWIFISRARNICSFYLELNCDQDQNQLTVGGQPTKILSSGLGGVPVLKAAQNLLGSRPQGGGVALLPDLLILLPNGDHRSRRHLRG